MDKTATDLNSPMEVSKRANQEDPIVMYLIVRESLGMGVGKTAAQCAHAAQMLQLQFNELDKRLTELEELDSTFGALSPSETMEWGKKQPTWRVFNEWLESSFRKVVLKADEKEWVKLKEWPNKVVVVDAGLTEIAAGSETVIGYWPMLKSEAQKTLIKRLQALK